MCIRDRDKYRQRFRVTGIYENRLYDGIQPLLEHLKKQGVKLAIASTKPLVFVEEVLRYFGIAPLFDAVCGTALDKADSDKSPLIRDALFKLNVQMCIRDRLGGLSPMVHASIGTAK